MFPFECEKQQFSTQGTDRLGDKVRCGLRTCPDSRKGEDKSLHLKFPNHDYIFFKFLKNF